MAKTLGLRVPAGHNNLDSIDEAVLSPVQPTGSLGSIVAAVLAASADPMRAVVDIHNRRVYAATVESGHVGAVAAFADGNNRTPQGAFMMDDDTKKSSSFSREGSAGYTVTPPGDETTAEHVLAMPEKPVFSLSTLISALEDEASADGQLGTDLYLVHVDQGAARVNPIRFADEATLNAAIAANGGAANADIVYEQIPPTEAQQAAQQAFE